ncbi:MAG: ABC transporter ATP-binding protein [Anaeromyxobacter sp.]
MPATTPDPVPDGARPAPTPLPRDASPAIEIEAVSRRFGDFAALDRVSLTIRKGEFFSMLGPSGCGKTTLLRIIGGLDVADAGAVRIGGVDALDLPAHRRPVNTVFQSYALFPHLSVRDNVAFGLRMKKVREPELGQRVDRALELVQITSFAGRKPGQLSGGQKQRVALARALVNEPQVLLLDEPLGALDLKLRKELQVELKALQRRLGITFVFVTHDQEEALTMSDRIAVMRAGRIEQLGEAHALYEHPRNRFVGGFLGTVNLIEGTVTSSAPGEFLVETPVGVLRAGLDPTAPAPTGRVTLAARPAKVRIVTDGTRGENRITATVEHVIYVGTSSQYVLKAGPSTFTALALNTGAGGAAPRALRTGEKVQLELPAGALVVLED